MVTKSRFSKNISVQNKKAFFEYAFEETFEAGIQLFGTEIKSIREGKINIHDAYCYFQNAELFSKGINISPYENSTYYNHEPLRDRKLLLTKRELQKLWTKSQEKGLTIIPYKVYINEKGLAKVSVALAKGKKLYDKRESIKEKDQKRELNRLNL